MANLNRKRVCITGTLTLMTREDAESEIKSAGGYFDKSVNYGTDFLVVADKPGATKVKKARSCGTTILTERQFLDIINNKPTLLQIEKPKNQPTFSTTDLSFQERDW